MKAQQKVEEQAGRLQEKQEQGSLLEAALKETKEQLFSSEQRREQQEALHQVSPDNSASNRPPVVW